MRGNRPPQPTGNSWRQWALQMVEYLSDRTRIESENLPRPVQLPHLVRDERATVDGILMYDPVAQLPVCSIGGVWVPVGGGIRNFSLLNDPSGASSYRIINDSLKCWGSVQAPSGSGVTVNFPKTFARPPSVQATRSHEWQNSNNRGRQWLVRTVTATNFITRTWQEDGIGGASGLIYWEATGEWDGVS